MKVVTPINFQLTDNMLSANNGELITVPDQALTPQQLIRRYSTGNLQGVSVNDYYFDVPIDSDIPVLGMHPTYYEMRAANKYITETMKKYRRDETKKNQQNESQTTESSSPLVDSAII